MNSLLDYKPMRDGEDIRLLETNLYLYGLIKGLDPVKVESLKYPQIIYGLERVGVRMGSVR